MKTKTWIILFIFAIACVFILGLCIEAYSTPVYKDTISVNVVNSEVHGANVLIEFADLDSADEAIVKEVVSEAPKAKQKAVKLIEILKNKDSYSNLLEWITGIITAIISLLTTLAVMVKKIRALSIRWSPIHWFEKATGNSKALLNGVKGTYKKVFVPEALETITQDKFLN
jgi:hypothetical protein